MPFDELLPQELTGFVESDPGAYYDTLLGARNYGPKRRLFHDQRKGNVLNDYRSAQLSQMLNTRRLPTLGIQDFLRGYDFESEYRDYGDLYSPTGRRGYTPGPVRYVFGSG